MSDLRILAKVDLFVDFLCPFCAKLFAEIGEQLRNLQLSGQIELNLIPLAWIDRFSNGEFYSTRSALAFLRLQEFSKDAAWEFACQLFARGIQPREASRYEIAAGSNSALAASAAKSGAPEDVLQYIEALRSNSPEALSLQEFSEHLRQGDSGGLQIEFTPSLLINGVLWKNDGNPLPFP